jgi:hypothetical protein
MPQKQTYLSDNQSIPEQYGEIDILSTEFRFWESTSGNGLSLIGMQQLTQALLPMQCD